MILYVNGDSHTAAAEAVNSFAFAEDDPALRHLHRLPHPDNLAVSWGRTLSMALKSTFKCDAESAASNARIMRTTRDWLQSHAHDIPRTLLVIQWSTWEREEWNIHGEIYQVNASGQDIVPADHQSRYQQWIADLDWKQCVKKAHNDIWNFHVDLVAQGVKHVFFNGNSHFGDIAKRQRKDWGLSYVSPYDAQMTWDQWLKTHGFQTVSPDSWHFGKEAHGAWSRFMLQYIVQNKII